MEDELGRQGTSDVEGGARPGPSFHVIASNPVRKLLFMQSVWVEKTNQRSRKRRYRKWPK